MPSKRRSKKTTRKPSKASDKAQVVFLPLLGLTLILWVLYRSIFSGFPVWFDEIIGKAIFFGLPVWLYMSISSSTVVSDTFSLSKLNKGLLLGIALGGMYGFTGSILGLVQSGAGVQAVNLFSSSDFWWEFFLALMTAFWETLFFFSWVMSVFDEKFGKDKMWLTVTVSSLVFMVFHIPNSILRFDTLFLMSSQVMLMLFFALGQSMIFAKWRNFYTLLLSHAIWGMVLMLYVV